MPFFVYNYYCDCHSFLFSSVNVRASTLLCGRNYLFVEDRVSNFIRHTVYRNQYNGTINCKICNYSVGGYVNGDGNKEDSFRFTRHLLFRQKQYVYGSGRGLIPQEFRKVPIGEITADPVGMTFELSY